VIDAQALIGDSTDNVPGAPGIGPKTAAEFITTFGSLDAILERANEIKQQKRRETLINFADQIRLSRELVTLKDDVDVEEKWESFALREPDPAMLLQFIDTMEFRTLGRRVREHFAKEKGVQIVASYASAAPAPAPAHADDGSRTGPVLEEIEREFKRDSYKIVRDLPALDDYIRRAKIGGAIGIDTEADSFDAGRAELVGLSLSIAANDAIYIPLQHKRRRVARGRTLRVRGAVRRPAPDTARKFRSTPRSPRCGRFWKTPPSPKIGINVKWDIALFAKHKIALAPYDDPMLASYTLYGGLDDHDKISLIEKHIGHGLTPYSDVAGKGKAQQSFDLVPDRARRGLFMRVR
jgi:DNA polymerase-1